MILESTYENKNRKAFIYSSTYDTTYTVEYMINGRIVNRTHHQTLKLAEQLANDYTDEAGLEPKFLNEETQ